MAVLSADEFGVLLYPNEPEGRRWRGLRDSDNPHSYAAWSAAGADADEQWGYFGRFWTWASSVCAVWKPFDSDRAHRVGS